MRKLFRTFYYFFTGKFSSIADVWRSNKHVMSATYDKSIEKSNERLATVKDAVAKLIVIETTRTEEIKNLKATVANCEKIKNGAKIAMQKRLDALKAEGISGEELKSKTQSDPEFIRHSKIYKDSEASFKDLNDKITEKEDDLAARKKQIAEYKAELLLMQKSQERLKEEKVEAIADVAIAQQAQQIADVLSGIAEDETDQDLLAVREATKVARAKAKIASELSGSTVRNSDNEYLELANSNAVDKELDSLLDWGESPETESKMENAKLPE